MPRPFKLLDSVQTDEGPLELRVRGERDFMISIAGRVLMSSLLHRSEVAVAELGCAPIRARKRPRVLIGGLGLGFTLRAALDCLPADARVVVAELTPVVVEWCRGKASVLTSDALSDPRVEVRVGDVMASIRELEVERTRPRFDAIVLDLYVGPGDSAHETAGLYGRAALRSVYAALSNGGVYAVWGEDPDAAFEQRLRSVGFCDVKHVRTEGGGPRHAVYLATR